MQKQKILVIDDDEMLRMLLSFKLSAIGYEVTFAEDGKRGIELAREIEPDLIVLDGMMPVMDGIETITRLKDDEALGSIPVLMLTARRGDSDAVQALSLGAIDFVNKPFNPEELVLRIQRYLDNADSNPAPRKQASH
jgi:DNA-binding response OmpR family regulator